MRFHIKKIPLGNIDKTLNFKRFSMTENAIISIGYSAHSFNSLV